MWMTILQIDSKNWLLDVGSWIHVQMIIILVFLMPVGNTTDACIPMASVVVKTEIVYFIHHGCHWTSYHLLPKRATGPLARGKWHLWAMYRYFAGGNASHNLSSYQEGHKYMPGP